MTQVALMNKYTNYIKLNTYGNGNEIPNHLFIFIKSVNYIYIIRDFLIKLVKFNLSFILKIFA